MRRLAAAVLVAAMSVGLVALPAGASRSNDAKSSGVTLSFDFSANSAPPSVSGPSFQIDVDVLPEHTAGLVRVVAVPPGKSGVDRQVCKFQAVDHSHVSCNFDFTAAGHWTIKTQFETDQDANVSAWARTNIRVGY